MNMTRKNRIGTLEEAKRYCRSLVSGLRNEQFHVICLNAGCYLLGEKLISEGSINEVNAYPRMIVETALNYNAYSVILCHNHPGGTNHPSQEDISATEIVNRLLRGIGIHILDHMVVSGYEVYSMAEHGDVLFRTG